MSKEDVNETQKVVDGETEIPLVEKFGGVSDASDNADEPDDVRTDDESESDPSD